MSRKRVQHLLREQAPRLEQRVYQRLGGQRRLGFKITRILPVVLLLSICGWLLAPPHWMRILTPYAGAAALLCAGIYLTRVVAKVGLFSHRHRALLCTEQQAAFIALKQAIYKMVTVLIGVVIMAGGFFYLSARLLHDDAVGSPLLWSLPIGGMVLSLFFGETVTRLIEFMDEVLIGLIEDSQDNPPRDGE